MESSLEIKQLKALDTASYLCAVSLCGGVIHVTQLPNSLTGRTGNEVNLTCTQHDKSGSTIYLYWYQQKRDQGLKLIAYTSFDGENPDQETGFEKNFQVTRPNEENSILNIRELKAADTATYLCAASLTQRHRLDPVMAVSVTLMLSRRLLLDSQDFGATVRGVVCQQVNKVMQWPSQAAVPWGQSVELMSFVGFLTLAPDWFRAQSFFFNKGANQCDNQSPAYFGSGTKLAVLGDNHEIQEPKVTLFEPSKDELKKKKKATLVCLATDFYPDHISLAWYLNGKELEEGFKTDDEATSETESTNKTQNTLYYISSRLRVPLKTWLNPENEFTCLVHFDPTDKNFTQSTRGKGACGVTPESFKQGAKTGTLSYVLLMSKSAAYAVFILFLAWKMKPVSDKRYN
nr:PREDICTED: uncharacterized protein LOC102353650 [Latimeria chalumnae]|eukprot:XP_014347129.1 PREDICTED: uncharacterized protein LOC102353650 [Latimeria chalumnae]